ncbi:hypothetical protein BaRGS_00014675 [Batillaria attramentaria]|uniref:VWFA domain-containing protein n=1 Tax=Batillaria attramentaria TaxID=370345 RepID=A0ABD0L3V3_9CAEN
MKLLACVLPFFFVAQLTAGNPTYRDLMDLADLLDVEKRYSKEDAGDFIKVCYQEPIELALVIDSSRSIDYRDFNKGQKFLVDFVGGYDVGPGKSQVRVSAVTFGYGVYTDDAFNLNTYKTKDQVLEALDNMAFRSGGRTDTGDAIKFMREKQMVRTREGVPKIAIVLTDGNSQRRSYTKQQAELARAENITIFAIGVGRYVSDVELLNIAGDEEHVIRSSNYESLPQFKEQLAYKTCVMKPRPTTTAPPTTTTVPKAEHLQRAVPERHQLCVQPGKSRRGRHQLGHTVHLPYHQQRGAGGGFQYGVVSGSCPDDSGFALNEYQTTDAIRQHLAATTATTFLNSSDAPRSEAFTANNGARPTSSKVDQGKLNKELQALLDDGVQVFVARTEAGINPQLPEGVQLLDEGKSMRQSMELVERICHINEEVRSPL